MTCQQCGFDAGTESHFCARCGKPLSKASGLAAAATGVEAVEVTRPPAPVSGSGQGVASGSAGVMLAPGASFGTRYRILRRLGQGGMGVVYQAWDNELGLAVALKLIRPESMSDPAAAVQMERRFKRELLVARQVTHKHVVRIHDLGEVESVKYLTMPFIEGFDLRTLITREGTLPVARAIHLARQIASGLAAAHDVGVIHRDLKPENVMVDVDDTAVIMDFGLARSSEGVSMTGTGAVMGTVPYMAPEQARGEKADHRADVYALGLVLYDMLAGRRRLGRHGDAMSEMLARMVEPPASLPSVEPRVPEGLGAVVARATEPEREKRFQTVREFLDALDALDAEGHARAAPAAPAPAAAAIGRGRRIVLPAVAAALVAVLAAGWWVWSRREPAPTVARDPVSVLIADFDNQTGDRVFDGALEQALSLGIEGASFITAYPRRDAERAALQIRPDARLDEATARLVCQREGIKTTLAGTIAPSGSGYLVSVRVIDPVPGRELASASQTASSKEQVLFAISALSGKVRTLLGDATSESAIAAARETFTAASLDAARDYAEGQTLANANRDEDAIAAYRRALDGDPKLGRAYAGWAISAWKVGRKDEAEQLFQKAFALVERMTEREKLRTQGTYYVTIAGNYQKAIETYEELVKKYPADGAGYNNLALAYFNELQFERAMTQGRRLLEIYPKSALYRYNYALYAMYAGDFTTAATEGRLALEANSSLPKAHLAIAMALLAAGDTTAAQQEYERARGAGPRGASLAAMGLADLAMHQGRFDEAVKLLEAGIEEDEKQRNPAGAAAKAIALAEAQLAIGRTAAAQAAVARAPQSGTDPAVLVPAAGILAQAGRPDDSSKYADRLDTALTPRSRAYARLIRAMLLLERQRPAQALEELQQAQKLADLWLVRYYKGIAYLDANANVEALSEFEACEKRRGEATAVFLDDVPSYRYMVPLSYWLGRAHEALGGREAAARHYRAYLALRSPGADALARDAARRQAAK